MPGRKDDEPEKPLAVGWYPDPWSATGEGERYYDGKRWGSSARPLARHSSAVSVTPIRTGKKVRRRRSLRRVGGPPGHRLARIRSSWKPLAILFVLILAAWGIPKLRHSGRSNAIQIETETETPTTIPNRPPPSSEEARQPLGVPAAVPAGAGKYETLFHQPHDPETPVAWDPCRPIHYVINPSGAPADAMALLQRAITRIQTATGLHFVYDGATTEKPDKQREPYLPQRYGANRWAPVLIAWSNEDAFPDLAGYIGGIGEPLTVYADNDHMLIVSGAVVFDAKQLSIAAYPDRSGVESTMLHELGHLVGLDHTSDKSEIMYSEGEFNVRDYGIGDRRGLALLGHQACFPNV